MHAMFDLSYDEYLAQQFYAEEEADDVEADHV